MALKKPIFSLIVLLSAFFNSAAQPYLIGNTSLTFSDASRNNRVIACDIYYPAVKSGTNQPLAGGQSILFPVISFGHGFVMTVDAYANIRNMLVPEGYILIFPKTEGSFSPSHANFGQDLAFVLEAFRVEAAKSGSLFYQSVAASSAVMGHSMGGGAAHLAAANNSKIATVITLAAAETNPSAIQAASLTSQPTLIIAGGNDCVTPPKDHQILIYNALNASCKTYLSLTGGSHCQMAEANFNCSFGEATCNPKPTISKDGQHALLKKYILPWLHSQLKNDCAASQLFKTQLNSDPAITFLNKCEYCVISNLPSNTSAALTGKVFPNPFQQQLFITDKIGSDNDFTCVLQSIDGIPVFYKNFSKSLFAHQPVQLDTRTVKPGMYILKIIGRYKTQTYKLVK